MTSLADLQQVRHIIEILRSGNYCCLLIVLLGRHLWEIAAAEQTVSSTLPLS